MENSFYLVLNIRTRDGFEMFGKFLLGTDREFANTVFDQLQGDDALGEGDILHIDMVEMHDTLPVNVKVRSCTLEQLACNARLITKEVFKACNLKEM